jgi:hypothetical protein
MAKALFPQFTTYYEELDRKPGDTLHVPISNEIAHAGTAPLVDGTGIPVQAYETERIDVQVAEYGNGVGAQRLILDMSLPDLPPEIDEKLGNDWTYSMNYLAAQQFDYVGHQLSILAGGVGTKVWSNSPTGTCPVAGTGSLCRDTLGQIYDHFQTIGSETVVPQLEIPGYGAYYGLIAHPNDTRDIKNDVTWENLQLYNLQGRGLFTSRVGVLEDHVIFETNMGVTAGTAYAFGADAVCLAVSTPLELYYYPDFAQDAKRAQVWKWYSVFNFAHAMAIKGSHALKVVLDA